MENRIRLMEEQLAMQEAQLAQLTKNMGVIVNRFLRETLTRLQATEGSLDKLKTNFEEYTSREPLPIPTRSVSDVYAPISEIFAPESDPEPADAPQYTTVSTSVTGRTPVTISREDDTPVVQEDASEKKVRRRLGYEDYCRIKEIVDSGRSALAASKETGFHYNTVRNVLTWDETKIAKLREISGGFEQEKEVAPPSDALPVSFSGNLDGWNEWTKEAALWYQSGASTPDGILEPDLDKQIQFMRNDGTVDILPGEEVPFGSLSVKLGVKLWKYAYE